MSDENEAKNPEPYRARHTENVKQQITINIDYDTIDYFKKLSAKMGIPYQTLINLYLKDCVVNKKKPVVTWE